MLSRLSFTQIGSERQFSRFVLTCMSLGFAALLVAAASAVWTVIRAQDHARWVEHTYEVERGISSLRVLIEHEESARRAYLLARRPKARMDFEAAALAQPPLIAALRDLTSDNPHEQQRLERLALLSTQQYHLLSASLALADHDRAAAVQGFDSDDSREVGRQMRQTVEAMIAEENNLLAVRAAQQRSSARILFGVLVAAGAMLALLALFSIAVLRRYTSGLIRSREAVAQLNDELEDRVDERTRDLSRANEEIQRFAYIVSHDLRSPLVNVMGFTGELEAATRPLATLVDRVAAEAPHLSDEEATLAAREDLPEAIRFIRTSTQKMDRLINAILRLSREGKRVLAPEPLDLAAMVETVVASAQHRLDEVDAEVVIERPMPRMVCDRLAMEQMLSNLIENAVKYRHPARAPRVVVSARLDRGRVEISVADNGRGIDPRDHDRIFDLFRRSGTQDQPGEGIGLAHVRALAYRLGGLIDCRSALGEGATFILSLPQTPLALQGLSA